MVSVHIIIQFSCLSKKEFTDTRGIIIYRLSIKGIREHRGVVVGIIYVSKAFEDLHVN